MLKKSAKTSKNKRITLLSRARNLSPRNLLAVMVAAAAVGAVAIFAHASANGPLVAYLIVRGGPTNLGFYTTNHDLGDCGGRNGDFYTSGASVYCSGTSMGKGPSDPDSVDIWAPSVSGYTFNGWSSGDQSGCNGGNPCKFYMPVTGSPYTNTIQAVYSANQPPPPAVLQIKLQGINSTNMNATVHDAGNCVRGQSFGVPVTCQGYIIGASYSDPSVINAPPTDPATGYQFKGWTGCNASQTSGTACSVYITSNQTLPITATYAPPPASTPHGCGSGTLNDQCPPKQSASLIIRIQGVPAGLQTTFQNAKHWVGGCHDANFVVPSAGTTCTSGPGYPIGNNDQNDYADMIATNFPGYAFSSFSGANGGNAKGCFGTDHSTCHVYLQPGQTGVVVVNYVKAANANPPLSSCAPGCGAGGSASTGSAASASAPVAPKPCPADPASDPTIGQGVGVTDPAYKSCTTLVQSFLNSLGYQPLLSVDGDFGPATAINLAAFQKDNNLSVDGVAGPRTWATFESAFSRRAEGLKSGTISTPQAPASPLPTTGQSSAQQTISSSSGDYNLCINWAVATDIHPVHYKIEAYGPFGIFGISIWKPLDEETINIAGDAGGAYCQIPFTAPDKTQYIRVTAYPINGKPELGGVSVK